MALCLRQMGVMVLLCPTVILGTAGCGSMRGRTASAMADQATAARIEQSRNVGTPTVRPRLRPNAGTRTPRAAFERLAIASRRYDSRLLCSVYFGDLDQCTRTVGSHLKPFDVTIRSLRVSGASAVARVQYRTRSHGQVRLNERTHRLQKISGRWFIVAPGG